VQREEHEKRRDGFLSANNSEVMYFRYTVYVLEAGDRSFLRIASKFVPEYRASNSSHNKGVRPASGKLL
jgi:hypothetical protein